MDLKQLSNDNENQFTFRNIINIIAKTVLMLVLMNILFFLVSPIKSLAKASIYNNIVEGRKRLPFGENPEKAYNFSLFQLDAMFASHEISQEKGEDEFRVILIGDSSTWGFLLEPSETISERLNSQALLTAESKAVKFYNLAYPSISLSKDLLMLSRAISYSPDLVIWLTTLEAFPNSKQLESAIVQNNQVEMKAIIDNYALSLNPNDKKFIQPKIEDKSIFGKRRVLADILRLQMYGIMWAATGVDQYYPSEYDAPQNNFEENYSFHDLTFPTLNEANLAFEVIDVAKEMIGEVPLIIVNEPILISEGENSDIRYNFFYPRWAYDQYREIMNQNAATDEWKYIDLWDVVANNEFTNSAIHVSPAGIDIITEKITNELKTYFTDH
jgi:hypothetical protein